MIGEGIDTKTGSGEAVAGDGLSRRLQGTPGGRFAREFFGNSAHFPIFNALLEVFNFVAIITLFLGAFLGFAQMQSEGFLSVIRRTADQLRVYSEWLLGPRMLDQTFSDTSVLSLRRVERSVLFMDIRGFTRWSERTEPEEVVSMLNRYYEVAEQVLSHHSAVKLNFTADEVMAPFETPDQAARAALALRPAIDDLLSQLGLSAGIGLNTGPLIQGLIGSASVKSHNVIGDVVNTAKRIESATPGGAVLVSAATKATLPQTFIFGEERSIAAKGKEETISVYELIGESGQTPS